MPSHAQAITGLILAGGLGQRMGRVEKGLQTLHGVALLSHVAQRLAPQVSSLLINANQDLERYQALGYPVVSDRIEGFAGPLAGLHAGLSACQTPLLVTAPCDTPFLPTDLVSRLHAALEAAGADLAIARTSTQVHPVFCLCRRHLLAPLEATLLAGERRFMRWCATQHGVEVGFDDCAEAFANINTCDDLAALNAASRP